eukprot:8998387-Prorocentrum_lima.AAC.1
MTSSLVGSEMCIRDRSRSPQYCVVKGCVSELIVLYQRGYNRARELHHNDCLLYTSDAADDM